ncbi:mechanosensitive ion channel family protein [Flavobacterium agrisoli]|uniref:Mechanosensitive ion channel family protein n=1 Tax=Flavobacterium agrisoli TaxID=2793066 RepID=A0A934PJ00_9FLAO|nr:mechanosensitive ion channel family protein [Flavobacterium agrisoli]MBK0368982.1 mechanosensitive ion channel family protein [Flavobacterium agrisoli]
MFVFNNYFKEIFTSVIVVILLFLLRMFFAKLVRNYAKNNQSIEHRTNLVIKYISILLNIIAVISLIIIWGVETKDIFFTVSSLATVIGVAMIAQWSILSNITAGVILFFSFPFKIGDTIRIHDKDFPIEAEIIDINAFHLNLRTKEGERIVYPNNLILQKGISIIDSHTSPHEFFD